MEEILSTATKVSNRSKSIKIDLIELSNFVESNYKNIIEFSPKSLENKFLKLEHYLNYILLFASINFCFWGDTEDNEWGVITNGEQTKRTTALETALLNYYYTDPSRFEFQTIKDLRLVDFIKILQGGENLKYTQLRWIFLSETFSILGNMYDGKVQNLLESANHDSEKILKIVTKTFPSFRDISLYEDFEVPFLKRAQVFISSIHNISNKGFEIKNIQGLTAFADYRLPQYLRHKKILQYVPRLCEMIDNNIKIPQGSPEEVEIRANTIVAIEKIRIELKKLSKKEITSSLIDNYIWNISRAERNMKPHHKTESFFY